MGIILNIVNEVFFVNTYVKKIYFTIQNYTYIFFIFFIFI